MATIEILRPNGVGAETNIEVQYPNADYQWDKVDETSPDEDNTYLEQSGTITGFGKLDDYNLEASSISPPGYVINSVTVYYRIRSTSGGHTVWAKPSLLLAGSTTVGDWIDMNSATYSTYYQTLARPSGGAWAVSDLADLQVGITIDGEYGGALCRCTQVYVAVDYTPLPQRTSNSVRNNVAARSLVAARNLPVDC